MKERLMEWCVSKGLIDYPEALARMTARAEALDQGTAEELIWLLEHPPLYTAGTSAQREDLLDPRFPVYTAGRGGQYTYHGPGQRVVYLMLDLKRRGRDVRAYVHGLEEWVLRALARLGVEGERRTGQIGIFVARENGRADKIVAIGVRIRRWVTLHGFAINVSPDLSHFSGIIPCGITDHGVTSLADLGIGAGLADLDAALAATRPEVFPDLRRAETGL